MFYFYIVRGQIDRLILVIYCNIYISMRTRGRRDPSYLTNHPTRLITARTCPNKEGQPPSQLPSKSLEVIRLE